MKMFLSWAVGIRVIASCFCSFQCAARVSVIHLFGAPFPRVGSPWFPTENGSPAASKSCLAFRANANAGFVPRSLWRPTHHSWLQSCGRVSGFRLPVVSFPAALGLTNREAKRLPLCVIHTLTWREIHGLNHSTLRSCWAGWAPQGKAVSRPCHGFSVVEGLSAELWAMQRMRQS